VSCNIARVVHRLIEGIVKYPSPNPGDTADWKMALAGAEILTDEIRSAAPGINVPPHFESNVAEVLFEFAKRCKSS
jgi:hypothetical protein